MSKIDWSKAPEGATHWSPANGKGRLEAYWRPDGDGMYDCWAVTDSYGGNKWQRNRTDLPEYAMERPTVWIGEGLPPVGLPVEWRESSQHEWKEVVVLAYADGDAWIKPKGKISIIVGNPTGFRPIRTPEQIIADREREERIKSAQVWLEGIAQAYDADTADKCEDILIEFENRKQEVK